MTLVSFVPEADGSDQTLFRRVLAHPASSETRHDRQAIRKSPDMVILLGF
jgi:hypothetical protein